MKMRKLLRNKKLVALVTVGVLAVGGTSAYAYWTSTGSGSGTATAAAGNNNLVISSNSPAGLYPGGSVAVNGTVANPNSYSVNVGTVSGVVTTNNAGCLPGDFTFAPLILNETVAAGASTTFAGTLSMADSAANQDACKSAVITLTFSSTSS
jgi:hypothetical protein